MVNGERIRNRLRFMCGSVGQRRLASPLDQPGDVVKGNTAGEKGFDRDLIRGIDDRRRAIAGAKSVEGHAQSRKPREIGPLEGQLPDRSEIQPAGAGRQPARIGQTMRNRHPHVGRR